MKNLIAVSIMIVFVTISLGWATWDGTVKDKNGNPLDGVTVKAHNETGNDPQTTSIEGFYSLDTSKGMENGHYYETVYITYGIGGSTKGGTFYESQHETKDIQEGQYYQDTK
jgi:hypothetical protein